MNAPIRLYALALRLYPRRFHEQYAAEMLEVFREAQAQAGRSAIRFLLREVADLPASLAREHVYALRSSSAGLASSLEASTPGGSVTLGSKPPRTSAWETLLAMLPHLIIALLIGFAPLFQTITGGRSQPLEIASLVAIVGGALLAVLLALFKRGRTWAGSWYSYAFLTVFFALLYGHTALFPGRGFEYNMEGVAVNIVFPLIFAFFLYSVARRDPLEGLLAALPLTLLVWQPYLESTPRTIIDPTARAVTQLISWLLLALAAGYAVRTRRLGISLILALLPLLLGGPVIVWLAIYQGGVLPYAEDGPNLAAVAQFYLRTLLVTAAFFLGPQLAVRFRAFTLHIAPRGLWFYRLSLAGLLLVFTAALGYARQSYYSPSRDFQYHPEALLNGLLLAGYTIFLAGFVLILFEALRSQAAFQPLRLAGYYLLIGLLPVILFLGTPIRMYAPLAPLGLLVPGAFLWIAASIWLVRRSTW